MILIFIALLFPGFNPGSRFQILFIGVSGALIINGIRCLISDRLNYRERSLLSALGSIGALAIARWLFGGVKFSLGGIILLYLSTSLLEIILPEKLGEIIVKH